MEMTAVWKERKRKSPFPLFPHRLGKLANNRELPTFPQLRRRLGFLFSPSSFNLNFDEKCYLLARYLLLPTCPFAHGSVLEVSAKVAPDGGQSTYVELRDLANRHGLVLSMNQRSKTAIALGLITEHK